MQSWLAVEMLMKERAGNDPGGAWNCAQYVAFETGNSNGRGIAT